MASNIHGIYRFDIPAHSVVLSEPSEQWDLESWDPASFLCLIDQDISRTNDGKAQKAYSTFSPWRFRQGNPPEASSGWVPPRSPDSG